MPSKSSGKKKPKIGKSGHEQSSTPAESDSRYRRPCAPGAVMGLDLSLTGCGVVVLSKKGKLLVAERFQTSPITSAAPGKEPFHGLRPSGAFVGSSEARIHWLTKKIRKACKEHDVVFALIEDHAFAAKGRGKTVLGELHGVVKNALWKDEVAFDLKTPQTIKKHATGSGRAEKIDMIFAAKAAGFDISDSDRADAWGAADMALRCYDELTEA
jgi:Holliday junction resolvasome RuvABC endonuclease subunit